MSMYPISKTVITSSSSSVINLNSIPSTFAHLQLRVFGQTNRSTYGIDDLYIYLNNDGTASYSSHYILGSGGGVNSGSSYNANYITMPGMMASSTSNSLIFGLFITDILDYTNTNKNKTIKNMGGADLGGTSAGGIYGYLDYDSGCYYNTNVVNSITIGSASGSYWQPGTVVCLYGIQTSNATGA